MISNASVSSGRLGRMRSVSAARIRRTSCRSRSKTDAISLLSSTVAMGSIKSVAPLAEGAVHDSPKLRLALCFDRQNGAPVARGHDHFLEKLGVISRGERSVERFLELLSQPAERGAKLRELGARIVAQIVLFGVQDAAKLRFELLQIGKLLG